MISANLTEIKANFKKFLDAVIRGERVTILRRNVPIAQIIPAPVQQTKNRTVLGIAEGTVQVHGDLTEPFMAEEDWEMTR